MQIGRKTLCHFNSLVQDLQNMKSHPIPIAWATLVVALLLLVAEAMKRASKNQTLAAKMLGISRQALGKRLKNIDA